MFMQKYFAIQTLPVISCLNVLFVFICVFDFFLLLLLDSLCSLNILSVQICPTLDMKSAR